MSQERLSLGQIPFAGNLIPNGHLQAKGSWPLTTHTHRAA